jgi:cystathionine beta-synthase
MPVYGGESLFFIILSFDGKAARFPYDQIMRYYDSILETIGETPLVRWGNRRIFLKLESFNPGLSVKDRIAVRMIAAAEKNGSLRPGGTIIECTSGNTGFSVAMVAAKRGYRCILTTKDKQAKEKVAAMRALGAEVILCRSDVPAAHPESYQSVAKALHARTPGSVLLNQYDNPINTEAHYQSLGPEIWEQTEGKITAFVAAMGSCGTLCGTAAYLKNQNPKVRVIGVDGAGSILKKLYETGEIDACEVRPYLTEGMGRDNRPGNFNPDVIDQVVKVSDYDAAATARRLAREEGIFVGWTSGATAFAAQSLSLSPKDVVVVLCADHGSKYLSKIFDDEWMIRHGLLQTPDLPEPGHSHFVPDVKLFA